MTIAFMTGSSAIASVFAPFNYQGGNRHAMVGKVHRRAPAACHRMSIAIALRKPKHRC
ncbi:MAG: hypothetical protein KME45_16330 [Stenomitos rutilans HA7619-LM2]|jgi:hypothetical protein|nr:hypothetical protein [Stenomitos rutilans HA7619-LM2]